MANELITARELGLWTSTPLATVEGDDFAAEVMLKVSDMAKFLGGHPDWTIADAPFDVKLVVLMVAKRAYSNPDQVVSEGVGPINERRLDVAAMLLDLTESERATLVKYNLGGDPNAATQGLWVQTTHQGGPYVAPDVILYVGDDQQVNLSQSSDPREWKIPMFNPLDPGGRG